MKIARVKRQIKNYSSAARHRVFFFLFLIAHFFVSVYPVAAEVPAEITADHLEYLSEKNTYRAKGSVRIVFENMTLLADEVSLNNNTNDVVAVGNVVYEDDEATISADKVALNLKTKLGIIYNSYIFYKKRNYHLRGGDVHKIGDKTFFLTTGSITTCDSDPPEWSLSGKDITATQHKSIRGWHGSLRIKNIPVLYTPYFWAPILERRQTGFLFPSFGYSSKRGHYYKQGFFWAIQDNQDATIYLDYYSEKGLAQGLDYRYILTPETNGEFWIYHVRDDEPSRNLVEFKSYHNQELPYDISGYLKVHAVNEFDYYEVMESTSRKRFGLESWTTEPFGYSSEERLQKYLESNLHLSRPFSLGRTYLLGQTRQSLEGSSREIPQSLPEMALIVNTLSRGPFALNTAIKGTNFWRKDGQKGLRLDINPNLYFSYGRLVNFTQRIGLRDTAYFLNTPVLNKNRFIADLSSFVTTRFFKKYKSIIHLIEPSLEYAYIPPVDNDNIPFFDSIDSIERKSDINYAITNRISGLGGKYMEMRLRLSQGYSLLDVNDPFTPVLAEATLWSQKLDFNVNASYDVHKRVLSETIGSITFKGTKGFIRVGKNFRRASSLDQVTFEMEVKRPITILKRPVPVNLIGNLWYDLNGNGVQRLELTSTYKRQCWGVTVSYIRRPDEYEILFAVELTGLATLSLGSIMGSI